MSLTAATTIVPATTEAPSTVRTWITTSVGLNGRPGAELRLIASELVTRAVLDSEMADEPIEVAVSPVLGAVQLKVAVRGEDTDTAPGEDLAARLLDGLAQRWGHGREQGCLVTWAEIRRPGAGADMTAASDEELLARSSIDEEAKSELVRRFFPMAQQIAARYRGSGGDTEDLEQVAGLALMKAINRFDPEAGKFEHYAAATISGELKRHLRDRCWSVRVPRGLQESVLEVSRVSRSLSQKLGRAPGVDDIAEETGWEQPEVLAAMRAGGAFRSSSLDAPRGADSDATIMDTLGEDDTNLALAEHWQAVAPALEKLPERERRILYLRFYEDLTQSEIAEVIGISQMHVSRLLARAIDKLRAMTGA
jgi:RNA polymerase sigma-B factor